MKFLMLCLITLREQGVLIRHNEQIDHLETYDDHVVLHLQSGKKN